MTDASEDRRTEAQNAIQYWQEELRKAEGAPAPEAPPSEVRTEPVEETQPYRPPHTGPGPRELMQSVHSQALQAGQTEEEAIGAAIAASARRAGAGDTRFLAHRDRPVSRVFDES